MKCNHKFIFIWELRLPGLNKKKIESIKCIYCDKEKEMTKEEYILIHARELNNSAKKRKKLLEKSYDTSNMTEKAIQKLHTDMNWEAMHYGRTKERLGVVLGHLKLDDLRDEWQPSGWHKYKGIREEMESVLDKLD